MGRQPKLKCAPYTPHSNRAKAGRDRPGRQLFGITGPTLWVWLISALASLVTELERKQQPYRRYWRPAWPNTVMLRFICSSRASRRRRKCREGASALHMDMVAIVDLVQPGISNLVKWAQCFEMQIRRNVFLQEERIGCRRHNWKQAGVWHLL